jgi:hypothetical protein
MVYTHGILIGGQIGHPLLVLLLQDRVLRRNYGTSLRNIDWEYDDGAVDGTGGLLRVLR